jgi:hypothetical protein
MQLPLAFLSFGALALAAVRELEWNVTYVKGVSPDGSGVQRTVIG